MSSSVQKRTIVIKNRSYETLKKKVEEKLNKLYPSSNLESLELDYDFNIEEEYKKHIDKKDTTINYSLIDRLPTIATDFSSHLHNDDLDDEDEPEYEESENEKVNIDIDESCLEKEMVGDKLYYFDHTKGIIYDTAYNAIGNIDDSGEINIES
tara:strand:- start:544 stop:1002 length:459 start_codon:yes stop_codon:yes gene_type:complete